MPARHSDTRSSLREYYVKGICAEHEFGFNVPTLFGGIIAPGWRFRNWYTREERLVVIKFRSSLVE